MVCICTSTKLHVSTISYIEYRLVRSMYVENSYHVHSVSVVLYIRGLVRIIICFHFFYLYVTCI